MRLPEPPLLVVTDRRQTHLSLSEVVEAVCAAGCRWISLREKDIAPPDQIALARTLLPIAQRFDACLIVHGDPGIAQAAGLGGVHLPAGSDPASARGMLGDAALIGLSVHSHNDFSLGADYVIAGPVYETASKPGYGPALEVEGFAGIARQSSVPVIAIGGITASDAPALFAAGASGIAVMGGVMRANDPGVEVRTLLAALTTVHPSRAANDINAFARQPAQSACRAPRPSDRGRVHRLR